MPIHLFHGNIWTHNWPTPNVSGFIAQLVRASHRYRDVTGSNPVEVLNFFQASLRNCINCVHNCEDHSPFDSFPSSYMTYFILTNNQCPAKQNVLQLSECTISRTSGEGTWLMFSYSLIGRQSFERFLIRQIKRSEWTQFMFNSLSPTAWIERRDRKWFDSWVANGAFSRPEIQSNNIP